MDAGADFACIRPGIAMNRNWIGLPTVLGAVLASFVNSIDPYGLGGSKKSQFEPAT